MGAVPGPVGVGGIRRRMDETPIPHRQKRFLQVAIGLFQGAHTGFAQVFHQAVLRGAKESLDAAFGLRTVRPDPGDPQLLQSTSDLGGRPRLALLGVVLAGTGYEQAGLVGVESLRSPVAFQIAPHRAHVFRARVVQGKARIHPAGGIVDHGDQIHLGPAPFQPVVLAGIPLH